MLLSFKSCTVDKGWTRQEYNPTGSPPKSPSLPLPPPPVAERLFLLLWQFMKKLMAEVPEPIAGTAEDSMLARTKVVEELETVTEG